MIALITYATEKYYKQQDELCKEAEGVFDKIYAYREKDIIAYRWQHEEIFKYDRGAGMWLWKSRLMLDTMLEMFLTMNKDAILVYVDCGDKIVETKGLREYLIEEMKDKDICLTRGAYKNSDYTKRDCFYYMNCDEEKYWDAIQIEAGIIIVKATEAAYKIMVEWNNYCENPAILTDEPSTCGLPNLPGFKDHRHDQSVLQNLCTKYNLPQSNGIRKYIHCNKR